MAQEHTLGPEAIQNTDETGITTSQKPGNVVAEKSEKRVGQIISAERTLVMMCCEINEILSPLSLYIPCLI